MMMSDDFFGYRSIIRSVREKCGNRSRYRRTQPAGRLSCSSCQASQRSNQRTSRCSRNGKFRSNFFYTFSIFGSFGSLSQTTKFRKFSCKVLQNFSCVRLNCKVLPLFTIGKFGSCAVYKMLGYSMHKTITLN